MNKVILTGRVVSEDYFKAKTTSGKAVLGFVIAVNNEYGGEPDFLNITAFGLQASNFEKYNKKGDLVEVIGKIKRMLMWIEIIISNTKWKLLLTILFIVLKSW
ncbi:putative single-stranded DNA-binding protein (plasmid) [Mycoplasmopsis fermentans]|nr:putative single-stranded DNA-binding protein [Mycoplasmopsis fermentans]